MKLKQRMLAWVLSMAMLIAPSLSVAEEWVAPAGEITALAISDDYVGGEQINLNAGLGLTTPLSGEELAAMLGMDAAAAEKKLAALTSLLSKCEVQMSFYDDFGTARIHGDLLLDGVSLVSGTALVFEDGSVQLMTNLTGKLVLTLPAGTVSAGEPIDVFSLMYGDFGVERDYEGAFEDLPAMDRLTIAGTDMIIMVFSHLLGWVSSTQMETGELYVFDDTYLEPTETRDGVAQRMIGTIKTEDFTHLLYNIIHTIRDDYGLFQQALADVLAENGVTRYQVRQVVDGMMPDIHMDPSVDWVQMSHTIEDDGALCQLDDIAYFMKKLAKYIDGIWYENIAGNMSMVVSYDDYGAMVGFDAVVPQIAQSWPFEGDFTYSIKTDDNWQRRHTSHGELQVYGGNRVVGDLSMQFGQDVEGVNKSYFVGQVDLVNKENGTSAGLGVDSKIDFAASTDENGHRGESFDGRAALQLRMNGESVSLLSAEMTGETVTGEDGFAVSAVAGLDMGVAKLTADVTLARAEYEDIPFAGGEAIDLETLDEAKLEAIKNEVVANAAGLALTLALRPGLLRDVTQLFE